MYKKKSILALILAMFLLFGISACGSQENTPASDKATVQETTANAAGNETKEQEKVTLSILHEHSEEAAANIVSSAGFRAMLDKYKAEHPWVTLEETIIANSEIQQKYLALIAANELPDVTYVKYAWLENMAGNNMVADLTNYVNPADYVDNLYSVTYKGKIYGMTNKFSVYNTLLYNEKMWKDAGFEKFPATLDELIAAAKIFKAKGIDTISLGNTAKWFAVSYFASPLLYDYCGKEWVESMIACENKYKWTDECFIKAMTKLKEMSVLFNGDFNMQDDIWAAGWYMQGKSATLAVGGWGVDTVKKMGADYPEAWDNTRVILLPSANGAAGTLVSACGAAVGVNANLKGAAFESAVQLCQQISSRDYAKFMAERASTSPVKIEMDFTGKGIQYEGFAAVLNKTPNSGLNFNDYFNQGIVSIMQAEVQSLLAGTATPQQVADKLQAAQEQL